LGLSVTKLPPWKDAVNHMRRPLPGSARLIRRWKRVGGAKDTCANRRGSGGSDDASGRRQCRCKLKTVFAQLLARFAVEHGYTVSFGIITAFPARKVGPQECPLGYTSGMQNSDGTFLKAEAGFLSGIGYP
jgi:hypothetical protein